MKPKISIITSCYRGEEYLEAYFENVIEQTIFDKIEIVFLHNAPTTAETEIVNKYIDRYPDHIQYIAVDPVEPLGASWNRGWLNAHGIYISIWNVDDRRTRDSFERQIVKLDQDADCALAYGDFIITSSQRDKSGLYRTTPQFNAHPFLRDFQTGGAFLVFRKNVVESIGYFDEQFKITCDYEYVTRMTLFGLQMNRAEGLLGYFTDEQKGLSTRDNLKPAMIELTLVQLRYGIYDKIKFEFLEDARKYRIDQAKFLNNWHTMHSLLPPYTQYLKKCQPLWIIAKLRNSLRFLLKRIGLWDFYLRFRIKNIQGPSGINK